MDDKNKNIIKIATPAFLEQLSVAFAGIIDSQMVSALGVTAISAVSVTNQPKLFLMCVFFAVNTVISALIAQNVGKKDRDGANRVFLFGMFSVLLGTIIVSVICSLLARPIMIICCNQADILEDSILYFRIVIEGLILNTGYITINAAFRGYGRTGITMVSNLISCLVNLLGDYLLITGHLGFPALGIRGAAIATNLGFLAATVFCFVAVLSPRQYINLGYCIKNKLLFTRNTVAECIDMWKKVFAENILSRIAYLLASIISARAGSLALSVYSVGMNLMQINFAIGTGLQASAVALVGSSYGASDEDGIRDYSNRIIKIGLVISVGCSLIFALFGGWYYGLFSDDDDDFIAMGCISCIIIAVVCLFQTQQLIHNSLLQCTGDAAVTMKIAFVTVTLLNVITLYVAVILLHTGLWGIWTAVLLSQAVRCLLLVLKYRHKYYLRKETPSC